MTTPSWCAGGLQATPTFEHRPEAGVVLRIKPPGTAGALVLGPELTRSLAAWLAWWVGDRDGPADPDRVRSAIDDARAALRARSSAPESTEDFRAGLAWCDHHLDAIAEATR